MAGLASLASGLVEHLQESHLLLNNRFKRLNISWIHGKNLLGPRLPSILVSTLHLVMLLFNHESYVPIFKQRILSIHPNIQISHSPSSDGAFQS